MNIGIYMKGRGLTRKGERELCASRERVEAGDSSVYEMIAQGELHRSINGEKGALKKALELYQKHDRIFSRRARKPIVAEGEVRLPKLIFDMKERDYP